MGFENKQSVLHTISGGLQTYILYSAMFLSFTIGYTIVVSLVVLRVSSKKEKSFRENVAKKIMRKCEDRNR